jgi:predicted protein tyrosine phosphatase
MSDAEKLPIAIAGMIGISLPFILGMACSFMPPSRAALDRLCNFVSDWILQNDLLIHCF